ncbi:efflux RND transporter periplasmic adaptor subunit [Estrella lausannensis]|uniref:Conserved putative membrane protein n=1 Tax=Estrella lausannensis TaxID=483423 RepID=A0A0H5E2F2_9BACT|nr:HlyD family efflux transporter periplasmic adaptor subunit [Estrella lausannensis]CRX37365.1 Conserved putative membrane protein [Estrella lausannensis]
MPEEGKSQDAASWKAVHLLATINRLSYSANTSKTRQQLIFLILNETIRIIQYQRATLWKIDGDAELVGVSGTSQFNPDAEQFQYLKNELSTFDNKKETKVFGMVKGEPSPERPSLLWLPIPIQGEANLGLLLERWRKQEWLEDEQVIIGFLMKNYATAWDRFNSQFHWKALLTRKTAVIVTAAALIVFIIPIDLPISAPCEVIAKDPYVIAAPLDGIIENVTADPGKVVRKGDILFSYDSKETLQELKAAEEEVRVLKAQLERSYILGLEDQEQQEQLAVLKHRLNKAQSYLDLAEHRVQELDVRAPEDGIVQIDDPDKWRGNPVKIGEKVLTITDPKKSMVKIWIPEGDNVFIDPEKDIKILLNISPEKTYRAQLSFLSSESVLDDHSIPSFVAEAEWVKSPEHEQLGLKGSATLYGPRVSVFYWLARRPWAFLRSVFSF